MVQESEPHLISSARTAAPNEHQRFKAWPADPASFSTHRVSPIRHNFHEHPLMQLPALAELAKALMPTQQCRFIVPGATQSSAFHHESHAPDGRSLDEVFRRIEEPGSWLALYNVQTNPVYNAFVQEVIASVKPLVEKEQPVVYEVGGFIFISAPPSVTPFHIDRENNFWLQVRGHKTMNVWDHTDRKAVTANAVEDFVVHGGLDDVRLVEEHRSRSHEFVTGPGDGVYFPMTSPHMTSTEPSWVRPGNGVSISIGVVFYTSITRRNAHVHALNRMLRRAGMNPPPPSEALHADGVRAALGRTLVAAHRRLRGYTPPRGF